MRVALGDLVAHHLNGRATQTSAGALTPMIRIAISPAAYAVIAAAPRAATSASTRNAPPTATTGYGSTGRRRPAGGHATASGDLQRRHSAAGEGRVIERPCGRTRPRYTQLRRCKPSTTWRLELARALKVPRRYRIRPSTRTRRSNERDVGMSAGLHPADSLNQNRADL